MASSALAPRTLSGEQFALLTAKPETRILFCSIVTIALGTVRGFRNGWPASAIVLTAGGMLAIVGMVRFGKALSTAAGSREHAFSGFAGMLPYVYGVYLVGYEGLWSIRGLVQHFSLVQLVPSVLFVYFGYRVVYWTWQLTEIAEGLRTGRIVVVR